MTNKEASEVLKASSIQQMSFCKIVVNGKEFSVKEALDTAIKVLEQEPCDDAISRPAVLSYISNDLGFGDEENGYDLDRKIAQEEIYNFVKKMPSIIPTPKKKTGNWIKYSIPRCGEQHYQCTSCGYYINFGQWGEVYTKQFKYCPSCSARMIEPQESEDKDANS